jgi:aryl-alcohol dehydrogenase-like predicted oxidoreductase
MGSSRLHLTQQIDGSLKRLKTDYIDVYHMHAFDALTPIEETLSTLDDAVRQGKLRYIAASNFSGWHMQKFLAISAQYGWTKYVGHQVYYSLVGRDYEWELMPQALSEGIGASVWSPLGWGRLTGKIRGGQPLPEVSRLHKTAELGPTVPEERLYEVVDALDSLSAETGKSVPQLALNWLLRKPTISTVIIGARNEQQLRDNLAAASFVLTPEQVARLRLDGRPALLERRCGVGHAAMPGEGEDQPMGGGIPAGIDCPAHRERPCRRAGSTQRVTRIAEPPPEEIRRQDEDHKLAFVERAFQSPDPVLSPPDRLDVEEARDAVASQATIQFPDEVLVFTAVTEENAIGRVRHIPDATAGLGTRDGGGGGGGGGGGVGPFVSPTPVPDPPVGAGTDVPPGPRCRFSRIS